MGFPVDSLKICLVAFGLSACIGGGDCIIGFKEVYQPYGVGGGSFVQVPVRGECAEVEPSSPPTSYDVGSSSDGTLVAVGVDGAKSLEPPVSTPISTGWGLCFRPELLSQPWTYIETDFPRGFVIETRYDALGLVSGTMEPDFEFSRTQEYLRVGIWWLGQDEGPASRQYSDFVGKWAVGRDPLAGRLSRIFKDKGVRYADGPVPMRQFSQDESSHLFYSTDGLSFCQLRSYIFDEEGDKILQPYAIGSCAQKVSDSQVAATFDFAGVTTPQLDLVIASVRDAVDEISVHCND